MTTEIVDVFWAMEAYNKGKKVRRYITDAEYNIFLETAVRKFPNIWRNNWIWQENGKMKSIIPKMMGDREGSWTEPKPPSLKSYADYNPLKLWEVEI